MTRVAPESPDLEVILGRRRAGKSTYLAKVALAQKGPAAIHDSLGAVATAVLPHLRFERVALAAAARTCRAGKIPLVYDAPITAFVAWAKALTNIWIGIDEGTLLLDDDYLASEREVRKVMAHGRHAGVRIAIVAQGANLLDYQCLALGDRLVLFAQTDEYNLQKLRACGIPQEVLAGARSLPDYDYFAGPPGRPAKDWRRGHITPIGKTSPAEVKRA